MTGRVPRSRDAEGAARFAVFGCALAALLAALLVCSGTTVARLGHGPHAARYAPSSRTVARLADAAAAWHGRRGTAARYAGVPTRVCSASGHGRGSGCSGASESGPDATLPGPPPQPTPAPPPRLPLVAASPATGPAGPLTGSDLSPDLHVLQILRT
jgi:hypothetical protein